MFTVGTSIASVATAWIGKLQVDILHLDFYCIAENLYAIINSYHACGWMFKILFRTLYSRKCCVRLVQVYLFVHSLISVRSFLFIRLGSMV